MLATLPMYASLPMYDWPEVRAASDAFWAALARQLDSRIELFRGGDHTKPWLQPNLLFSQTCGYPFTHALRGKVAYVATPHYLVDGCDGPSYSSLIFGREAKPLAHYRGSAAAINSLDSMSGMLALRLATAPLATNGGFFGSQIISGSHVHSLELVQAGAADVCAVDAVCIALAKNHRPELLHGLVEVGRSPMVPGLPYITQSTHVPRIRDALSRVFADDELKPVRTSLCLGGISILNPQDYDVILDLENAL